MNKNTWNTYHLNGNEKKDYIKIIGVGEIKTPCHFWQSARVTESYPFGGYYTFSNETHRLLSEDVQYNRNEQAEEAVLKAQILTLLKKQPLSNQQIRQITRRTAQQVRKMMTEMKKDGVTLTGKGRGSKYALNNDLKIH